jgi:hypothetical protein
MPVIQHQSLKDAHAELRAKYFKVGQRAKMDIRRVEPL